MIFRKNICKTSLLFLIIFIFVSATTGTAIADAATGELFGYQISDSYPMTKKTRKKSDQGGTVLVIRAENPKKPEDVGKVYVVTSTMTHTIGKIYSTRKFRNQAVADKFSDRYAAFLSAKYRKHSPQSKGLEESSKLLVNFENEYELRIKHFPAKEGKVIVQIGLSIHGEGKKKHAELIKKEHDQLLIKNAETKGRDKGL
ncbi:MAG: hypothetical protein BMS9Abin11_1051 [Gammaproteobacteria bacterium]|nr:MAG: hypothetical protein BMS9Abin11_1051 [Gammaproteobacteria bacterium]